MSLDVQTVTQAYRFLNNHTLVRTTHMYMNIARTFSYLSYDLNYRIILLIRDPHFCRIGRNIN